MIFYIKDQDSRLFATCKFNKEANSLILEKSSFIKKEFNCAGCDTINALRNNLFNKQKLKSHNEEVYLLKESIEIKDINSAACLVLGGKMSNAENLIKNEFDKSIKEVYAEVFV